MVDFVIRTDFNRVGCIIDAKKGDKNCIIDREMEQFLKQMFVNHDLASNKTRKSVTPIISYLSD